MSLDNLTAASLRDSIKSSNEINKKIKNELRIANLLKMLELGLINKNMILEDQVYLAYKEELEGKIKIKKRQKTFFLIKLNIYFFSTRYYLKILDNIFGDNMKVKTILSSSFAIVIGILMGKFMLNQYDSEYELSPVFNQNSDHYYFLNEGEYDSYDSMEENMMGFDYYIYEEKNGKFLTYIGITKDYDNMMKIQGYFKNAGYNIYVSDVNFKNEAFSVLMDQYDQMLKETEDNQTIKGICSQVLAKYEELVLVNDNDQGYS